jgi:dTMP kinase
MAELSFYGSGLPYRQDKDITGKLIVLEGTDGVGRSTQCFLLRRWLEDEGFAVSDTGLRRSPMTQPGLNAAKAGHIISPLTMALFYATDFADRLENHIIPALKAGFIVLSDRYFYSTMARDVVRGADPQWTRKMYGFAPIPDMVVYLRADVPSLVTRMVHGPGFTYWESGMDIRSADNLYDSFCVYQARLIDQFDQMADEFNFLTLNANRSAQEVFDDLRLTIKPLLSKNASR